MRRFLFVLLMLCLIAGFIAGSGYLLVQNNPEKSDVVVVLAGERTDGRYRKGLEMLRAGYGNVMLVDAAQDFLYYGHTPAEYAAKYIQESAGADAERVKVCPYQGDATKTEVSWVVKCMQAAGAKSAVIVTSDHHTRRALSVFRVMRPDYRWTVAPSFNATEFGVKWWQHRQWAKMWIDEWQRMLWWQGVDRWRK